MEVVVVVLLIGFLIIAVILGEPFWVQRRRRYVLSRPFPNQWREILAKNIGAYPRMPRPLQKQLEKHILIFLDEKDYVGCGGLEITDEIRVTIAGQACMLLLNRPATYYPKLMTILVYPSAYVVEHTQPGPGDGLILEGESVNLGESWNDGRLVLSWDSALYGGENWEDGSNVVIHEFAHQLDQESGTADGAPLLQNGQYSSWAKVLSKEFQRLQKRAFRGKRSVLDHYGATNPAEFFAVATETFFEKPHQMKKKHSALYDELKKYYHVDPVNW